MIFLQKEGGTDGFSTFDLLHSTKQPPSPKQHTLTVDYQALFVKYDSFNILLAPLRATERGFKTTTYGKLLLQIKIKLLLTPLLQ